MEKQRVVGLVSHLLNETGHILGYDASFLVPQLEIRKRDGD
jgi:hypothetical protein